MTLGAREVDLLARSIIGLGRPEEYETFWKQVDHQSITQAGARILTAIEAVQFAILGLEAEARSAIDSIDASAREAPLLASRLCNVEGLLTLTEHPKTAAMWFLRSCELFQQEGNNWSALAARINAALAQGMSGETWSALEELRTAEHANNLCAVPEEWRVHRWANIQLNRGLLLFQVGDMEEALSSLLRARPEFLAMKDTQTLAHLDYNLAVIYQRQRDYTSLMEAASNARAGYTQIGGVVQAARAAILLASALRLTANYPEAEATVLEVLSETNPSARGFEGSVRLEALNELHSLLLNMGRTGEAKSILAEVDAASDFTSPELAAIQRLLSESLRYMEDRQEGRPVQLFDPSQDLEVIRSSGLAAEAPLIAEVLEIYVGVIRGTRAASDLSDEHLRVMGNMGMHPLDLKVIEGYAAAFSGDQAGQIDSDLIGLYLRQLEVGKQRGSKTRAWMLYPERVGILASLLPTLTRENDPATLFDVIESQRVDMAQLTYSDVDATLPTFRKIIGGPTDEGSLAPTPRLRVCGRSRLARLVEGVELINAEDVLESVLGGAGVWANYAVHQGVLYWSAVGAGAAEGGAVVLDAQYERLLERHASGLPVVQEIDYRLCGDDERPWCRQLVAIARAARGPLMGDLQLYEEAVSCLPAELRRRVQLAGSVALESDLSLYQDLGRYLLPPALEAMLTQNDGPTRLLLSIPPDLASVPFCLLGMRSRQCLVEACDITAAPPLAILDRLTHARSADEVSRTVLVALNPLGDLAESSWDENPGQDARFVVLRGERGGVKYEDFAKEIRALASPKPTALAFIGHIDAGNFFEPGSSALLFGDQSGGTQRITALDIFNSGLNWPAISYLGACEGAGFGTGHEWASVSAAILASGGRSVIAHSWPVIDSPATRLVDEECILGIASGESPSGMIGRLQRRWLKAWRDGDHLVSPHSWAGLQVIGLSNGS